MTEQEQIEEMAKFMHYKAHGKDKDCDNEKCEMCWCSCKNDAELLYNAGYRKLPEDSVVLSKEEYEMLANQYKNLEIKYSNLCDNYRLCKDANETLKQNVIIARKETAKEILNAVVGAIDNGTFFRQNFIFMMNKVYGVEVEMANNDKTIEQANKKIVRQFYNKIQKMLDETRQVIEEPCNGRQNAGYCVADIDNGLKELAKQFGVEIKE